MSKEAVGWSIDLCDDNHIHLGLFCRRNDLLGELMLEDFEDIAQFCDDLRNAVDKLRMRKVN